MNDQKTPNSRDDRGRFPQGTSGNPRGRPRRLSPAAHLEQLLQRRGNDLLEHAFEVAQTDANVLAALLNFLASCQVMAGAASIGLSAAPTSGSAH